MANRKIAQLTAASSPVNTWVLPIQEPTGAAEAVKITATALKTLFALVKGDVGLGNVDNTSDATKNSATATLINKTISLTSNSISGTVAEFNAALTGDDFATLANSVTLTNKTISGASNTITNIAQSSVTSLVSDLALKAPLASPALTGNPTATTQSIADDSTKIATTAFVWDVIDDTTINFDGTYFAGDGSIGSPITFTGAAATVSDGDKGDITISSGIWNIDAGVVGTTELANSGVTLAKIQNASANSKLLGSGASGSGSAYTEITLGSGLSMTGTTLSATGGGGGSSTVQTALYGTLSTGGGTADIDLSSLPAGTEVVEVYVDYTLSGASDGYFRIDRTGSGFDTGSTDYNYARIGSTAADAAQGTIIFNCDRVAAKFIIHKPLTSSRLVVTSFAVGVNSFGTAEVPVFGNTYLANTGTLKKIQIRSAGTGFGTTITGGTWRAVAISNT